MPQPLPIGIEHVGQLRGRQLRHPVHMPRRLDDHLVGTAAEDVPRIIHATAGNLFGTTRTRHETATSVFVNTAGGVLASCPGQKGQGR